MTKLMILQGLPASGKSTFAKAYVEKNPNWVRVNRDDLRHMRGKYWLPKQEGLISDWEKYCVGVSLASGYSVVLDATNLNPKYLKTWKDLQKTMKESPDKTDFTIEYKKFDTSVEECIKRDLKRANSVGEDVIRGMYDRHIAKTQEKYVPDVTKPAAVIFDIDGTLARITNRSPYDWDRVGEDKVIKETRDVLELYRDSGYAIIIFTGRDGVCEDQTKCWLEENAIQFDHFDIRPAGDTRKGTIVKREMFDKIKDKYNVTAVYDDRDCVVRSWRDLGLQTYQVAYGNF